MAKSNNKVAIVALGAVIAAGAGYVAGLLTAPKSGKETRQDLASGASAAKAKAEKQLEVLQGDLSDLIKQSESKLKGVKGKAGREYSDALEQAKIARSKAKMVINAMKHGDADDPHLQAVIEEVKLAKRNLANFIKK